VKEVRRVLLTFHGARDPDEVVRDRVSGAVVQTNPGPILSLLEQRRGFFQGVRLFFTPDKTEQAAETARRIQEQFGIEVVPLEVGIEDPTDYAQLLAGLRTHLFRLRKDYLNEYYIFASPGTSQMHTAWVLLAASGEITANILQKREERFAAPGQELITEINPRAPYFPSIEPVSMGAIAPLPDIDHGMLMDIIRGQAIIGRDEAFLTVLRDAAKYAPYDKPVLILGETGTGKEKLARLIHDLSKRQGRACITVNCATLSRERAESELFGHKKGSFTGAIADHTGYFELAHGGTLFLDEIGDLAPDVQAKVLRALQEGEIAPLGGRTKKVDVRIIAATNVDLAKLEGQAQGTFRKDLYHRLAVAVLRLPPLRARRGDIDLLARHFVDAMNSKEGKGRELTPQALAQLRRYDWPGNVRELKNTVERAYMEAEGPRIETIRWDREPAPGNDPGDIALPEFTAGFSLEDYSDEMYHAIRAKVLRQALEESGWNQSKAARLLGCADNNVSKLVKRYGIMKPSTAG